MHKILWVAGKVAVTVSVVRVVVLKHGADRVAVLPASPPRHSLYQAEPVQEQTV
jgi:hypothetical protein